MMVFLVTICIFGSVIWETLGEIHLLRYFLSSHYPSGSRPPPTFIFPYPCYISVREFQLVIIYNIELALTWYFFLNKIMLSNWPLRIRQEFTDCSQTVIMFVRTIICDEKLVFLWEDHILGKNLFFWGDLSLYVVYDTKSIHYILKWNKCFIV